MTIEHDRRPAGRARPKRQVNWLVVGIIAFTIAVAALGAWADSIGGNDTASPAPAATATVAPVAP